mgnify:CR=1 FL=1
MSDNEVVACPNCGGRDIRPTRAEQDEYGVMEFRCEECGEYFTADYFDWLTSLVEED